MAPREDQARYDRIISHLDSISPSGATAAELSDIVHLAKRNVLQYLRLMRNSEPKLVYIKEWRKPPEGTPGSHSPVYARKTRAFQKDAPKIAPKSNAQKQADYRDRNKAKIKAKKPLSAEP